MSAEVVIKLTGLQYRGLTRAIEAYFEPLEVDKQAVQSQINALMQLGFPNRPYPSSEEYYSLQDRLHQINEQLKVKTAFFA